MLQFIIPGSRVQRLGFRDNEDSKEPLTVAKTNRRVRRADKRPSRLRKPRTLDAISSYILCGYELYASKAVFSSKVKSIVEK